MEFLTFSKTVDNVETFTGKAFLGLDRVILVMGSDVLDSQVNPAYFVLPTIPGTVEPESIFITFKLQTSPVLAGIFPKCTLTAYAGATILWSETINIIVPGFLDTLTNSYCTLDEADAYHSTKFNSDTWFNYSDGDRERALVGACNLLETIEWVGEKPVYTQTLQWPRVIRHLRTFGQAMHFDYDLNVLGIPETPINIKSGQAELAFQIIKGYTANSPVSSLKIGPINIQSKSSGILPLEVMNLVKSYINTQVRLIRT